MATFDVKPIEEFDTTNKKVFKLTRNGKCLYDEFKEEIEADNNLEPELDELFANIEDVLEGKQLPKSRYRKLNLKKLKFKPYESKSKHLRVYLFRDDDTGQIIICGGKKTEQDEDLDRVKKIIKEYSQWKLEQKRKSKKGKS